MKSVRWISLFFSLFLITASLNANTLDRPPKGDELDYAPADRSVSATNPPAFIWLPADGVEIYILQYSPSLDFDPEITTTVRGLDITLHIPVEILKPGTWFWRYGYLDGGKEILSRPRSFEIPETATIFPFVKIEEVMARIPRDRPRLHFTPELVEKIRSDKEGRYDHITENIIKEADKILSRNEPLFEEPRPWNESEEPKLTYVNTSRAIRPYIKHMLTSALAYLYTGNERYANEARRHLMKFMGWDVNGTSTAVGLDSLGMDIAENSLPVFDWIYPVLSREEREICKKALTARLHQMSYEIHRSRPMETRPFASHAGRMIGFVVEGAIALAHDVPEAADWMEYTLKLLWGVYPAWGHNDGGWSEGISYWATYMRRMFRVVAELDRLGVPLKEKPFFRNTGYYGLYAAYPNRPGRAFGDGHELTVAKAHGELMYYLSCLYGNPYFRWHADVSGVSQPFGRDAFLYPDIDIKGTPPVDLPASHAFKDVGLVAMHSNMTMPDENVTLIFQSNPFGAISHNFACQNAFVIEAYGEPLAISTGSRQIHGCPHHREWMWHTKAHNSILVDNEGQVIRKRSSSGKIIYYEDNKDYVYTAGDATQAYGGRLERFHRHVLFIRPEYVVIIDDLKTSGTTSTFQWLLHSPTEIQVNTEKNIMVNLSGNVRLTSRFLVPIDIQYVEHTGFTPQVQYPDQCHNQFHLTASTRKPNSSMLFVTLMRIDRTTGSPAKKTDSPSTSRQELQIRDIENPGPLDKTILQARLLKAEGGIAIRMGNDLILWRNQDSWKVTVDGVTSTRRLEFRSSHFPRD